MQLDNPLSDQEFDELDQFLLSGRCAEDSMTMDILHGYLTALVIGPEEVPLAEWLPHVWGPAAADAPQFTSERESRRIIGLIQRFMNEVATTLAVAPKEFEPLFCEQEVNGKPLLDGAPWAWGFWEGMGLRDAAWAPIWASPLAALMRPFRLLGTDQLDDAEQALIATPQQCAKLALEIEAALPHLYAYWRQAEKPVRPVQ